MNHTSRGPCRNVCILLVVGLLIGFCASSAHGFQQGQPGERGIVSARAVVNFLELARKEAENPPRPERRVAPFMPMPPEPPIPPGVPIPPRAEIPTPIPQPEQPSPSPAASFEALGDNNTAIPPDTQGTVGLNHLMVALNTQVRIQNKSGGIISTVSLNSFWSATGATFVFDPRLAYDAFLNRYIFGAVDGGASASSSVLIGVSQSNDPTGNWNLSRLDVDAANVNWADFPSLGFNKDWIVLSVNTFTIASFSYVESRIYAFNKANLYAVPPAPATFTVFTDTNGFAQSPAVTHDSTLATMWLVENWNGNSGGSGFLRLSTITGPVNTPTYTTGSSFFVSTPNPWSSSPPGGADFAPQRDTSVKIQNNDSRIRNPVVYRNGSLWASQTAFLPAGAPTRSAAQWWQINPANPAFGQLPSVVQFGRVDDSTGANFFAFPSIAVNAENAVLFAYSCFSSGTFASACYSYREATDTPNTLRASTVMKGGEATYQKLFGGSKNRWGDYSSTVVDPVNDLAMWTIQEYAASPHFVNTTDFGRWGTWWVKIVAGKKRRGQVTSQ